MLLTKLYFYSYSHFSIIYIITVTKVLLNKIWQLTAKKEKLNHPNNKRLTAIMAIPEIKPNIE